MRKEDDMKPLLATTAALALAAGGALAQEEGSDPVAIGAWTYDQLYEIQGIRGERLLETQVRGADGADFGQVENLVIADERITAIIAEVDGFADIGDTHVIIPWDEVELGPDGFETPLTRDTLEDYDLWADGTVMRETVDSIRRVDDGGVEYSNAAYRLTDLVNDYVTAEGVGQGYVDDAIFARDGELRAVVWLAQGGYYALPFRGSDYGYRPATNEYELQTGVERISDLKPFRYENLENSWF